MKRVFLSVVFIGDTIDLRMSGIMWSSKKGGKWSWTIIVSVRIANMLTLRKRMDISGIVNITKLMKIRMR